MEKFVFAITTFNRIEYLKKCIETWDKTKSENAEWKLIIADDGSTDGTKEYLKSINIYKYIENNSSGVAHQTNTIFQELEKIDYDLCFKADDDIFFISPGWDRNYWCTIKLTGYEHLCYDNPRFNEGDWCKGGVLKNPQKKNYLIALTEPFYVKGCFYTVTPSIQREIGYMDSINFLHGLEHVDFSFRCARAGFNSESYIFDSIGSNKYIGYIFNYKNYKTALTKEEYIINGNDKKNTNIKKQIIYTKDRIYLPFKEPNKKVIRSKNGN